MLEISQEVKQNKTKEGYKILWEETSSQLW